MIYSEFPFESYILPCNSNEDVTMDGKSRRQWTIECDEIECSEQVMGSSLILISGPEVAIEKQFRKVESRNDELTYDGLLYGESFTVNCR
jgi:hypothetical protein